MNMRGARAFVNGCIDTQSTALHTIVMADKLVEKLTIRITTKDRKRLDALVKGDIKEQALARVAFKLGLADLEKNGEGFLRVLGASE